MAKTKMQTATAPHNGASSPNDLPDLSSLLDLSTQRPPRHITVDGKQYRLPYQAEFSLADQKVLRRQHAAWVEVFGDDDKPLDAETEQRGNEAISAVFARVMKDNPELHERLTVAQKVQVLGVFFTETSSAAANPTK